MCGCNRRSFVIRENPSLPLLGTIGIRQLIVLLDSCEVTRQGHNRPPDVTFMTHHQRRQIEKRVDTQTSPVSPLHGLFDFPTTMACRLVSRTVITLVCLVTLTYQNPITKGKSATLFSPQCVKEASYFNVNCLVLLWDVSRHPVYGTKDSVRPSRRRKRDDTDDNSSDDEEFKKQRKETRKRLCGKKRLIDCPSYREVIEEEFMGSDIECSPVQRCNSDVKVFINRCAVDENARLVRKTCMDVSHCRITMYFGRHGGLSGTLQWILLARDLEALTNLGEPLTSLVATLTAALILIR